MYRRNIKHILGPLTVLIAIFSFYQTSDVESVRSYAVAPSSPLAPFSLREKGRG